MKLVGFFKSLSARFFKNQSTNIAELKISVTSEKKIICEFNKTTAFDIGNLPELLYKIQLDPKVFDKILASIKAKITSEEYQKFLSIYVSNSQMAHDLINAVQEQHHPHSKSNRQAIIKPWDTLNNANRRAK